MRLLLERLLDVHLLTLDLSKFLFDEVDLLWEALELVNEFLANFLDIPLSLVNAFLHLLELTLVGLLVQSGQILVPKNEQVL